jgi:secreted trypsin-like serine protease
MRHRTAVLRQVLIGFLATVVAAVGLGVPASAAVSRSPSPYIVKGTDAPAGAWPWIAVLLVQDPAQPGSYFQYCDASLIAPSWVLTAAHCVTGGAPAKPDKIIIGRQTPSASDGDINSAVQVIVHPSWNPSTTENDLALIRLAHPSPQTPLPLIRHEQDALWVPGATAEVIGFGDTNPSVSPSEPATLQQAPQQILADSACAAAYAGGGFVSASMVCATNTPQTPCFGDSGGPLMAGDGAGGWRQIGVVSHGSDPCGQAPPVYTRLASEIDWIYPTISDPVSRLFGSDRVATAIAASQSSFPAAAAANAAVLANFQSFADALPGTPLAVAKHGPLLLTPGTGIDGRVESELARVLPGGSTVYVLGGAGVMSSAIDSRLGQLGYTVVRYGGTNRFQTATIIADQGLGNPATVVEATGLGRGRAGEGQAGGAVLLTNGSTQAAETAQYLTAHPPTARFALGGPAAAADAAATAIVGGDRYATSALVAQQFFANPTTVGVASGLTFPDALSGGAHIGSQGGPILLIPSTGLIVASVKGYLQSVAPAVTRAFLYGGPSAVSIDLAEDVGSAIT